MSQRLDEVDVDEVSRLVAELRMPGAQHTGVVRLGPFDLEYRDAEIFASTVDLIFGDRIYDAAPLAGTGPIIDGGAWVGLSVIRFRQLYPETPIVAFEPDPDIFEILRRNVERNGLTDIQLVNAALAGSATNSATFLSSGTDGGSIVANVWHATPITVPTATLSTFVPHGSPLVKLNIEGAEADVIRELGDVLRSIDQVLIEYHGFSDLPQSLHEILAALHSHGHTYVVSHFNERNRSCVPPLAIAADYRYFLLIYARRLATSRMESPRG
ncbi:FkbM family methyltransferase [uncultured Cellulomonas sp.]|uniref:FkbM family methyltransferase n=1 Tax=uncultured Cellulomonas sp. TaxID=189682 RepID=UPI0028E72104|nr:FkbM family methyltransferase [uncultured Cellulomonas sp.]